nr:unnamed protein product [Digitaria exilis]
MRRGVSIIRTGVALGGSGILLSLLLLSVSFIFQLVNSHFGSLSSFCSIVRRAVAQETIQQIVHNLEPLIRKVVREEIQSIFSQHDQASFRCRKFRIGVRIMHAGSHFGERIQEAVSESFVVKDHRGELYEKHYPPLLTDNIWRLRNIGKDGPIVKRLESEGIRNVQEFLKLNTIDPAKLRAFHVKQLATQAYKLWDKLEEVTTEMPFAATKCLNPLSNSGRRPTDSQESIISSGSQNAKYLDYTGTATSSAAAAMSTNSSNTSGSAAAAPTNDDMFWTPSIPPDDQFGWQNSTGCWD